MKQKLVLGNKAKICHAPDIVLEERTAYVIKEYIGRSGRRQRAGVEGEKAVG